MSLRIGSLFTGTGALDLAVMDVFDAEVVWHSQYEPPDKNGKEDTNQYAAKILARHWPDIPNLGDITKVDWQAVIEEHGPIDVLTGGFPCQDVSSAGRRAGLTPDSRSGLWTHMAHAISVLQPKLVVIENVEGLLSAPASSDLEHCPWCMGDGDVEPVLRACGAVLGDLASLGLDAEWGRFGADEVGAPHRRRRIIIYAWPAALAPGCLGRWDGSRVLGGLGSAGRDAEAPADAANLGHERGRIARDGRPGPADRDLAAADAGRPGLEVGGVEPDRHELPAAERGRGESSADSDGFEPERRGVDGVLGGQAAAEQGEGHQRERARHAACDSREAAADTDGRGCEGHQERDCGPEGGQPEREPGLDPVGRGLRGGTVEPDCPTCGCGESFHDAGGFCAGPCGGTCTDPELGRPDETPADAPSVGHGDAGSAGQRGVPAATVAGCAAAGGRAAPADADQGGRREDILDLRPGQPDLDWGDYGPAIRRWGRVLGRPAPWPTDALGRLSPVFTEWLMGLPDGWVTDTPGLTRPAMLRALGNGVVWHQAAAAIRLLYQRATDDAGTQSPAA
ncbi:DNA cytosine methyltransferase [Streptomyces sp. SID10815]|uniref:DNA cytosine methyltransferase n=1 Tax=Streptomyces sp. SID10815 TaxID=2706027 RepID=UPI001940F579|nr:DNA cytosine methyltransferase [Streptomyces sp. SID10815]